MSPADSLIEARNLKKYYAVRAASIFRGVSGWVRAVDGVSFSVAPQETFGLVGESGCGKTTTSRLLLLLERPTGGSMLFRGKPMGTSSFDGVRDYRRAVQAVFQDPGSSLDPRMKVKDIIAEPIRYNLPDSKRLIKDRVPEVLQQVGLSQKSANLYPHEFSGGQRQRIAIARALAVNPSLIVLDEPVSALDVSIRAQIMNLLKELQDKLGVAYFLIAHDLATIRYMSRRVGVMYLGKLVECATGEEIYKTPLHPYTEALLLASLPQRPGARQWKVVVSGEVPSAFNPPSGCRFHPRCPRLKPICSEVEPTLVDIGGRQVACHLYEGTAKACEERKG